MDKIEKIKEVANIIKKSDDIVFLGGAGVSTESNIRDFRGVNGIYNDKIDGKNPEDILSLDCFNVFPHEFYNFYKKMFLSGNYEPSRVHKALVDLEKYGLKTVITQNIDNLHQKAGSSNVIDIHGNGDKFYCMNCGKEYNSEYILKSENIYPICEDCECCLKPDITLYGDFLNEKKFNKAIKSIKECDTLIVGGTSLTVYPVSELVTYYRKNRFILINDTPTPYDNYADILINDNLGDIFDKILEILKNN